ncbi:beta-lactamase family protein [Gordonia sp. HY442]|uniref:serine hydrolase domain-containing protein n=1 Tax=Gordonia zhenghanii TaxID=2911516 RepID=UPI001F24D0D1|nr:serine hydrolase domain-containing protein [Gordonia zhenghanii]MCF8606555.1 beta-lactamase family protein [Gordonia zhenghanii]
MTLHGHCAAEFAGVRAAFDAEFGAGHEVGASLCVMVGDDVVVDLWGGVADDATGRPWLRDTVATTYSVTKTMTALAILALADRGVLDVDQPVARYWPEFGEVGKGEVTIAQVLDHTSGVSGWERPMAVDDLYHQPDAAAALADQAPWWTPGDGSGYHALTFGTILAEVIRRVTGVTLGSFLQSEIAGPLGADYRIGMRDGLDRIAPMIPPPPSGFDLSSLPGDVEPRRTLGNPMFSPAITADPTFLAAELGAVNGQGNARSVARIQSVVTGRGRAGGRAILSAETVDRIFDPRTDGVDRVLGVPVRFGLGWALSSPAMPGVPDGEVCWWTGFGGAVVSCDVGRGVTVAYVMNAMAPGLIGAQRPNTYLAAVYGSL